MANQVGMIVGGSTDMVLATAQQIAAQGRTVLIVRRDRDKLERARAALERKEARVETIRMDISVDSSVQGLIAHFSSHAVSTDRKAKRRFERIDYA